MVKLKSSDTLQFADNNLAMTFGVVVDIYKCVRSSLFLQSTLTLTPFGIERLLRSIKN